MCLFPSGGMTMLSCGARRLVAVTLVLTTVVVTMPLSGADLSKTKSIIGSVSAVGPVQLRGIGISQEGTLFPGDSIRSGQKGYAKVILGTGSKIEVDLCVAFLTGSNAIISEQSTILRFTQSAEHKV